MLVSLRRGLAPIAMVALIGSAASAVRADSIPVTAVFQTSVTDTGTTPGGDSFSVTEDVYKETGGTIDFTLQLTHTTSTVTGEMLSRLTVLPFSGTVTDTGYTPNTGSPGDVAPSNSGVEPGGNAVFFDFLTSGGDGDLAVGMTTDLLIVKTSATSFGPGTIGVIDGGTQNEPGFGVAPLPSTATAGFSLLSGLAVFGFAFRKRLSIA